MSLAVQEVVDLIKDHVSNTDHVFIDFSGGKYSLVLLHLALRALRDVKVVYVDTTISLRECTEYVEELCDDWGVDLFKVRREDADFWSLVKRKGFPTPRFTWCARELKFAPLNLLNKSFGGDCIHLTGTTMNESTVRRKIYSIRGAYHFNYTVGSYVLHPILTWNEKMVLDYAKKYRLPMNPSYVLYGNGGNCFYCPHIKTREYYLKLSKKHPKLFLKLVKAERNLKSGGAAIYVGKGELLYMSKLLFHQQNA